VTAALPFSVNVHVFVLSPPLEQAPDQIASRSFVTLKVIDVPVLNGADPVLPTVTLIPAGLDITRSPLRPVAVTDNVAVPPGGGAEFTVRVVVRVTPPNAAEIVAVVVAVTVVVVTVKVLLVEPAGTVTLAGVDAADESADSETVAPPLGAAALRVTVPVEEPPPVTLVGLSDTAERVGPVELDGLIVSVALCVTFS
jgi:hypothetical protein